MEVSKAYKVRIYPNKQQEQKLLQIIGACRWVYNYYLTLQINAYYQTGKNLPYAALSADLTKLRHSDEYSWLEDVQGVPLQQALRVLDVSYNRFFRKLAQMPKFKTKKDKRQSFRKPRDWRVIGGRIQVQSDTVVKYRGRGLPTDAIKMGTLTISVTRTGKWYASIVTRENLTPPTEHGAPIGIDVGLRYLAVTSDGTQYDNPTPAKKRQARMRYLSQSLSRKQKDSHRREKARLELARLHEKIANQRLDHLHRVSHAITSKNHALIAMEDLSVINLVKNRRLSRSISDVSWGELVRQIEYKQRWRGGQFVKIDRFFPSSKMCSNCQMVIMYMPLSVREWDCPGCGIHHDRDVNAAKNILKQAEVQLGVESTDGSRKARVTGSMKRGHAYA